MNPALSTSSPVPRAGRPGTVGPIDAPAQGSDTILVEALPGSVWSILIDSTRLPDWMPVVSDTSGRIETLGAERECDVEMDGRRGRVIERCVVLVPERRIGWCLVEDTLGFSRLLSGMAFDFALEPVGSSATRVVNTTYYRTRGPLAWVLGRLLMRRRFSTVRRRALGGLARLAEADATPAGG